MFIARVYMSFLRKNHVKKFILKILIRMGSFMILLKELHGDWYFKMAATSGQNVTKDIWQLESEYKTNFQKQQT
jgi:hypothetical protein